MKRLTIIGIVGITTLFFITACTSKNSASTKDLKVKKTGKTDSSLAIAFYYQDSIATQFDFYREIDSIVKQKQLDFQNELQNKVVAFQKYQAEIQKRYNNNEITGYEIDDIKKEMAQKQQSIQTFRDQKGQALQTKVTKYTMVLSNKISAAAKTFSKENHIDLLLYYQKGGQITYINNAYDVTKEFISYLNNREKELRSGFKDAVDSVKIDSTDIQNQSLDNSMLKK